MRKLVRGSVWSEISPCSLVSLWLAEKQGFRHLPEILHVLGEEQFIDFLRIFAGRTISVPGPRRLNATLRKVVGWMRINELRAKLKISRSKAIDLVAVEERRPRDLVVKDYTAVEDLLREFSQRLQKGLENERRDASQGAVPTRTD